MSTPPLEGLRLLIVEDELLIALDIESTLSDAGALTACARTVAQALALVETTPVDGAVLDYRLETETSAPIADRLTELGVPFLFHCSGSEPSEGYPQVRIVSKPTQPQQLVEAVKGLTGGLVGSG